MLVVSIVCARRCMCKCLHMRLCVSIWMFTCVSVCVCVYMCFSIQYVFATFLCVCLPVSVCHILCPARKPARWQSAGHVVPQQGLKHSTHSQAHSYKFFINCTQLHCGQEVASHNKDCGECRCRESCFPQKDFNGGISFIFTQCWWIHQLCSLIISVLMMRKRRRKYAASALCCVFPNFLKNVSPPIDVSSVFPTALTSRHLYSNT